MPMSEELAPPKVFVVDDDPSVRRSLVRLLRSYDYVVEEFASAEQFLQCLPYGGLGCALLDMRKERQSIAVRSRLDNFFLAAIHKRDNRSHGVNQKPVRLRAG